MAETFDVMPQYIWESASEHNVLITTFETGKEQRRYKGARPRQWNLTFKGNWATVSGVVDFFNARKGSYEAFIWLPPGETNSIYARFKESSLNVTRYGLTSFGECSVTLIEVLT